MNTKSGRRIRCSGTQSGDRPGVGAEALPVIVSVAYEVIVNQMPFLASNLAYFPIQAGLPYYEQEKALYSASRVPVVLEAQLVNR